MVLFRRLLGDVLRAKRMQRGMTLREVSAEARVSLGYISEIERGQKEASSELLASLCAALDVPLSEVLQDVSVAGRRRGGRVAAGPVGSRGRRLRRLRLRPVPAGSWGTSTSPARCPGSPRIATATVVPHRRHGCWSRR